MYQCKKQINREQRKKIMYILTEVLCSCASAGSPYVLDICNGTYVLVS